MITINVCIGSACHIKGSYNIINGLQQIIDERGLGGRVCLKGAFCLGECTKAVSVKIGDGPVVSVQRDGVEEFFNAYIEGRL